MGCQGSETVSPLLGEPFWFLEQVTDTISGAQGASEFGVAEASDCRIQSNGQAGVVSKDVSSVVSLRGCEIFNNGRMGVAAIVGGTVNAVRCSITANDRVGMGAWHSGSKVSLVQCDVNNNGATGGLAILHVLVFDCLCLTVSQSDLFSNKPHELA